MQRNRPRDLSSDVFIRTPVKSGVLGTMLISPLSIQITILRNAIRLQKCITALLQDWLGASDTVAIHTIDPYIAIKAPVIEPNYVVAPECYIESYLNTSIFSRAGQLTFIRIHPQIVFIDVELSGQGIANLKVVDMKTDS